MILFKPFAYVYSLMSYLINHHSKLNTFTTTRSKKKKQQQQQTQTRRLTPIKIAELIAILTASLISTHSLEYVF